MASTSSILSAIMALNEDEQRKSQKQARIGAITGAVGLVPAVAGAIPNLKKTSDKTVRTQAGGGSQAARDALSTAATGAGASPGLRLREGLRGATQATAAGAGLERFAQVPDAAALRQKQNIQRIGAGLGGALTATGAQFAAAADQGKPSNAQAQAPGSIATGIGSVEAGGGRRGLITEEQFVPNEEMQILHGLLNNPQPEEAPGFSGHREEASLFDLFPDKQLEISQLLGQGKTVEQIRSTLEVIESLTGTLDQ